MTLGRPSAPDKGEIAETEGWAHFPHDADLGIRGFGQSPERAFEQVALALTAAVTDAVVEPREQVSLGARQAISNFCWSSG